MFIDNFQNVIISEGFHSIQAINDSSQNVEILAFALAVWNSICFCECLEDRPAFNLDAKGTFVGATAINKWLSLVFFLRRGGKFCYSNVTMVEGCKSLLEPELPQE